MKSFPPASNPKPRRRARGFSLLEVLFSALILGIIMLVVVMAMRGVQRVLTSSRARVEQFKEARSGFEVMGRRLGQATLNAYWGYDDPTNPRYYQRKSELHFICGPAATLLGGTNKYIGHSVFFQAPFGYAGSEVGQGGDANADGLEDLMNGWGYFVEYGSDLSERPDFLKTQTVLYPERKRFRLKEFRQPSEYFSLFRMDSGDPLKVDIEEQTSQTGINTWFRTPITGTAPYNPSWSVGENILCVILSPQGNGIRIPGTANEWGTALAPNYTYDSRLHQYSGATALAKTVRHQLPPEIRMTLIAMDEATWSRMTTAQADAAAADLITTVNTRFTNVNQFDDDLESVQAKLRTYKLDFRVFSTSVALRGAKWITDIEQ